MSKRWNNSKWSIQTRILVLTLVICIFVLAVTEWLVTLSSIRALERARGERIETVARYLTDEAERFPAAGFPPDFQTHVREFIEMGFNISRVDIYADFDGELKLVQSSSVSGDRALEGQELAALQSGTAETFITKEGSGRLLFSVHPLEFSDGRRGFLTVVKPLQVVDEILAIHVRMGLYSVIVASLLLVLAITWLFRTTVYRSVRHLVAVMQRFQTGEVSARADEDLVGEFGQLACHFNRMLEEIQRLQENLQQGIEEATAELAKRNRELRELNLQLYEAQKRLTQAERLALAGQLTATFAHEVGSPLSAVSTHLQMLMEECRSDSLVYARLRLVSEQIDRVCAIVENLLATTRQPRRRVPVDLEEIILKVAHLLSPTMESRQIRFEFKGSGGPFLTEGDPDQLQQLFLNLFNNSLDAIPGAGTLSVEIRREPPAEKGALSDFRIDVRDSGIGISADRLQHIFDPLFTTKEFGKGSGLGLAVSKKIVRQHGGQISVSSTPGQGSCFTILLPEVRQLEQDWQEPQAVREVEV
ncbi:MAG: ATP-binding protein [Acidobacteriota bacterium]|nr:ATP-binding protein [Blastocatellia bacterium]MDW8238202.1 ATP-binding protein [Acidobacteriota bacterium]